jgi:serine/threonine protein kinase/Tol biopolymer transport system component
VSGERWERLRRIFFAAVERAPQERGRFLDEACQGDPALRGDVESLLASHDRVGGFLEMPALADASLSAEAAAQVPALAAGARLGPYEIAAAVGSGGMGEVYRARDPRLDREVAVKVLPRELAADPERRSRFGLEARAASALNHPNIVAVYDAGWHEGAPYMVTELLEGQTLDERVAHGALPVRKALEWAVQAARGLVAAHEQGIVHRDLKPANLFITSQGQLKILDFGIAKLSRPAAVRRGASGSGEPATTPGLVLGTAGYMSPEQVRGVAVDFRSDQFSLGCVLYLMLTGQAPFRRPTAAQTMAAVLEDEPPPLADSNARVPRPVAWVVERCLAKDPDDRYSSTRDLARDLELALQRLSDLGTAPAAPASGRRRMVSTLLTWGVAALAGAALALWRARPAPPAAPLVRYLTYSGRDSSPAAAPDGKTIAFSSTRDGRRRIWLKQLATGNEVPLTEGEDDHPRFSPDGSLVLFVRTEQGRPALYRVSSFGGEPRKLVNDTLYGDYSPDGRRIAFVRQAAEAAGMSTVIGVADADGGSPRELGRVGGSASLEGAFVQPRWSPDGRHLAATESTLQLGEPSVIALLDAESGRVRRLPPPGRSGVWPGGLAWAGPDELLCAEPESVVGLQTGSSSRLVLLHVGSGRARPLLSSPVNLVGVDVLGPGRLVLEARTLRQHLREVALDPAAASESGRWLTRGSGADRQPIYARDGEWIAFSSNRSGNQDLWAVSRRTGAVRRLTDDPAHDFDPAFMPDGRLLWSSNRSGHFEVWLAEADGSGARQVTQDGVDAENPVPTPDGRFILYASANPRARGIMKVRPDGGEATLVVAGNLIEPEVAPDGRHVAFVADQGSERAALGVARLADGKRVAFEVPLQAWIQGGTIDQGRCRWLPDGRSLVYVVREPDGGYALHQRGFVPEAGAGAGRRLAGFGPDLAVESLGVSADGAWLTLSLREQWFDLMLAEGVPGLERARR